MEMVQNRKDRHTKESKTIPDSYCIVLKKCYQIYYFVVFVVVVVLKCCFSNLQFALMPILRTKNKILFQVVVREG